MTVSMDIGTLISRRADFKSGDACIAGTGVRVKTIAGWYKVGHSPEQIADGYEHITIAQVYAALAYYHANRAEIEALMAEDERVIDELKRAAAAGDPTVRAAPA